MNDDGNRVRRSSGIEHTLSGLLLLVAVLALFDFGRMYYYQSRLKYAVEQATRFAGTGSVVRDFAGTDTELSRTEAISFMVRELSGLPQLDDADIEIVSMRGDGTFAKGAGGPGDVVTVTVTYRIAMLTPYLAAVFHEGVYEFSATTTFRNDSELRTARASTAAPAPAGWA